MPILSARLLRALVICVLGIFPILRASAATFTVSGTTLAINLTAANESVAITAGASDYSFALTGGTWSGTDSADATGNGTATLSALKASFTAVTVDDGSTGNAVTFNTSGANTYAASFTVTLDDATAGTITFNGNTDFTGSAAFSASTSRNITINSGAVVSVVDGALSLSANQQVTPTSGTFVGVLVNSGVLQSTGTGVVSVTGRGGDTGTAQYGVRVNGASARIQSSSSSNVTVTGTGGASSTTDADGLRLEAGGKITTTGAGSLTIVGTGGGGTATTSTAHIGVRVFASEISTVDGALSITGTGGATTSSSAGGQYGIVAASAAQIKSTGNGTVTLDGRGGGASGSFFNQGIQIVNAGTLVTAKNGLLTLIGTNGAGTAGFALDLDDSAAVTSTGTANIILQADNINLTSNTTLNAGTNAVTLIAKTAGRTINLGGTDSTTQMGLSATEIGRITAGTLSLGGTSPVPGPLIVSASITFPSGTAINLNYSTISYTGGSTLSGGSSLAGSADIAVEQPAASNLVDGTASVAFGTVLFGSSADLVFTVKSVGLADLTELAITLDGANASEFSVFASPVAPVAPNGSTTFTVRFAPTSTGNKTAALHIASNDPDESPFDINLTGFGRSTAPFSGTFAVGPTGDYSSLTAAIADLQAQTLSGPLVLELQPAYLSSVETFPLVFSNLGTTAANTLTIRPQAGATALSISSAGATAATVSLNGAQFVTLDGRPGGVGTVKQLTIENTAGGSAVELINEASNNTIRYALLKAVPDASGWGIVSFRTTTGTNGNDNNTIEHCNIGNDASTTSDGIGSSGSAGTITQNNSGNIVSNCNIFNFSSAGVRLSSGNTDWTISGNSFYQTANRAAVNDTVNAININNISGNNFTVTGNFIGGSAPNCGGTPWTTTGTSVAYLFYGIRLSVGTTTASSVQGNTIANMVWTSSSTATALPGVWSGIFVQAGSANVGTVTGNTIGSDTGTGSISVTTSGSGGTSFGIAAAGTGTKVIANNTIGSITVNGSANSVSASLVGIQGTQGANTISNNTVGSTTTANSLNAANSSTSTTGQQVTGILSSSTGGASITGNTVANLNNNYAATATTGLIRGIVTSAGVNTITGNTVRNLSTTSANANTTTAQSVYGIIATSTTAGQTVSQNTVHSLANAADSAAVNVSGIYFAGSTSGTNLIARNFVHSLALSSSSLSSQLFGVYFANGTFTAQNNMVRVGLKADGTSTAGASIIYGIVDNGSTAGRNFYHNTVYLGGMQTAGAGTQAFQSFGTGNTRTYQNNIFVNARSNSGATARHNAVIYGGTGVNPTGLTAGGNIFVSSGIGGAFGFYNSANVATLAAWQAATGQDATSAVSDPLLADPTGTAATVDLHLQTNNPVEGGGIVLTDAVTKAPVTVSDDFDGQTRSTLTPVDIGADAGNFTLTSDLFAPGISYPLLTSGSTANRVLTGWATIVDNASGSVASGANAPRLYYKKSTDADVFGGNTSADNGWKYVTAIGSGPYSFTLDYSLINGGSGSVGDAVQYFVVAQDAANNLGSSPAGATASANPPVQNVNAKPGAGVNSFSILASISGTKTVGTIGDYPSLSGAGGLFAALNASVLTGNVVVTITSDLTEDGGVTLNEFASAGFPFDTYTLTLQPDSATMRTISGAAAAGLITLNGADRVTIDGRFGGSGRWLTFRNTNTVNTASTIRLQNDSSSNTIRNCVVEGASIGGNGVINIGAGTVTGNDNNLITANQVRDRSDAAGVPVRLIVAGGSSLAVANSGNTLLNNELFNFNNTAISIGNQGDEGWTVSGNEIYEVNPATATSVRGIEFFGTGSATGLVTGNYIHDLVTVSGQSLGIVFLGAGNATISGNRITAFNVNASMNDVRGITAQGSNGSTVNIVNNQITLIPATAGSTVLYGLFDNGTSGTVVNAYHNSIVLGGSETGTRNSWASYRQQTDTHTSRNNLLLNLRTGSTSNHFAAGRLGNGGSYTASHNVYAGTGTTAANFMDYSTGTTTPVSFATWQTSTGDTSTSGSNPGGNYSTAMFVNAATGDLHLIPGGNVLVNGTGTPIAGVTTDYDGDTRSATTPTIGADEILLPDIAVTQTSAVADGGSIDFGTVTLGSSSAAKTFTITNPGTADLTGLAITGATSEFTVSALSGTSVPVGSGSVTFSVTFTPSAGGARTAALQLASNVTGAKHPYDIVLNGTGQTLYAAWAAANSVPMNDANLLRFAFGANPVGPTGPLQYTGTLAGGGTLTATGEQVTLFEPSGNGVDFRGVFVRRKDFAAAGLTYTPQFSATLGVWQNSAAVPTVLADDGTHQIVSVPYPFFIAGKKARFFRIQVTLAP